MWNKKEQQFETPLHAADLLRKDPKPHPLRPAFVAWCVARSVEETKRQAAKFLQANPSYRTAKLA